MDIIVEDTNILIDLVNTGLAAFVGELNIQFLTTSLALREIEDEHQHTVVDDLLAKGFLTPVSMQGEDYIDVILTHSSYRTHCNLSQADVSLMLLAEKRKCRLLTSDQQLRRQATQRGIQVNGFLWLTDLLVEMHIVTRKDMVTYLRRLIETNTRAPQKEIFDRIADYNCLG